MNQKRAAMKIKKSLKADIDRLSSLFFHTGVVISLLIVIAAFRWETYLNNEPYIPEIESEVDNEIIDVTRIKTHTPPKPPQPVKISQVDPQTAEEYIEPEEVLIEEIIYPDFPDIEVIERFIDPEIVELADKMPEFDGNIHKFILKNISYPENEKITGIAGVVLVNFIVEPDGSISGIEVERSVSPGLDQEAVRVIKLMKNWTPGEQKGIPVRVRLRIPIKFNLMNY
jgi:periplasmic protein TonB